MILKSYVIHVYDDEFFLKNLVIELMLFFTIQVPV